MSSRKLLICLALLCAIACDLALGIEIEYKTTFSSGVKIQGIDIQKDIHTPHGQVVDITVNATEREGTELVIRGFDTSTYTKPFYNAPFDGQLATVSVNCTEFDTLDSMEVEIVSYNHRPGRSWNSPKVFARATVSLEEG